jgi:RNA polymerase primary sigma factor
MTRPVSRPLPDRIERIMLASARPLTSREVVEVLSRESDGRGPAARIVERELRNDATRYRRVGGSAYVHVDRSDVIAAIKASPSTEGVGQSPVPAGNPPTPRRDIIDRWVALDPRLYAWQTRALAVWEQNERRGIVSAVTGAGKTNVAIAAISVHVRDGGCAVVLVPTQELMEQWAARLVDWSPNLRRIGKLDGTNRSSLAGSDVLVCVVNSAVLRLQHELGGVVRPVMLVADECHRYGAESFSKALTGPFSATLGLSATPERPGDDGMRTAVVPQIGNVVYEYGYEDALADGVIAEFEVTFVGLELASNARRTYDELTESIAERLHALKGRYPDLDETPYLFEDLQRLLNETHDPRIGDLFRAVSKRQQILQDAPARLECVNWLARRATADSRAIFFHARIDGCEQVAAAIRDAGTAAAVHHSGLSKTERKQVLRDFERGTVKALCSPRTLDEGIDVPDADFAVIVAGTTVSRQRIQRLGRVLRRADGKSLARGFVLYIRDSVEDPQQRTDRFAVELQHLGRASWARWPADSAAMAQALGGGLQ